MCISFIYIDLPSLLQGPEFLIDWEDYGRDNGHQLDEKDVILSFGESKASFIGLYLQIIYSFDLLSPRLKIIYLCLAIVMSGVVRPYSVNL